MSSATDYKGLITRYLDDQLDADEEHVLFKELLQGDFTKWQKMLEVILLEQIPQSDYNQERWTNLINKITESKEDCDISSPSYLQTPTHRIHFLRRSFFRYAAAVLLILGAGAYLWTINKKADQTLASDNKHLQTDVAPGGEKAVLTLADGTKIILDNAANGNIAQQGNAQVVKLANGQIAYDLKGLSNKEEVMWNTMSTPKGGQYQVILPDGTKAWLNTTSSITYPTAFVANKREVRINGEVYFEVAKNKQKPFIVDVNGESFVEVLGTSFNVNSYENEASIKTTLLEGSVKVTRANQSAVLKPGQQAVLKNTAGISVVNNPDIDQALAWKNGMFDFNGADLNTVMRQLERWYDTKVQYQGAIPDITFTGKIYRNVNLSHVLDMLRKTGGVQFRVEGKTLVVL